MLGLLLLRERERETETETDRQTDRQTDRHREPHFARNVNQHTRELISAQNT